jgi:hypothetical protein
MIKNPDGKVYVRYHQPVPKLIKFADKNMVTDVRWGVAMLLVEEEDVPAVLAVEGGCCGGKKKVFSLPSQEAINVWETGHR